MRNETPEPSPAASDDLIDNRERRTFCIVVVDTGARSGREFEEIENELAEVRRAIGDDPLLALQLELTTAPAPLVATAGDLHRTFVDACATLAASWRRCRRLGIDVGSSWLCVLCRSAPAEQLVAAWRAQVDDLGAGSDVHVLCLLRNGAWRLLDRLTRVLGTSPSMRTLPTRSARPRLAPRIVTAGRTLHLRALDRPVRVGSLLHRGPTVSLHELADDKDSVAKLFHAPDRIAWSRIEHLVSAPLLAPADSSWRIAWPLDIALDESGARVGFVMPRADGRRLLELHTPRWRNAIGLRCPRRLLVDIAVRLATLVATVHARGDLVLGGLSGQTLRWSSQNRLWLIGIDHAQVTPSHGDVVPCSRWSLDHLPLPPAGAPPRLRRRADDVFAVAVLVHALLLEGAHPFDGRVDDPALPLRRLDRQRLRLLPGLTPGLTAPPMLPLDTLPLALIDLFHRTFTGDPGAAPTADEYVEVLRQHLQAIVRSDR
ncbi:MAG: hypothetical protein KDC98_26290 [Planctomycetes bacterium]|nr:hypothetical protein [Planctomycetota bacterium]